MRLFASLRMTFSIALHQIFLGFKSSASSSFIGFTAWLTLLGISLGVMSLIVVMSVMNGFETELQKNIIGQESHIILYRKDKGIENWEKVKTQIQRVSPDIVEVSPGTWNEGLFIHDNRVQGGILEGQKNSPKSGCIVGEELAHKLNLKKNDTLKMLFPQLDQPAKIISFKVLDIFKSGLYEYSSRYVYANLSDTQKKSGWGNTVSLFKIKIKDPYQARWVARKIRTQIAFPFFVKTWMDINRNIFTALKIEKVVMAIILGCIILVSFFNVVSSLVMIVLEKTKEISILKALGMKKSNIVQIFLWQGMLLTMTGIIIGVGLAFGVCKLLAYFRFIQLSPEIYYLSYLPVEIRWAEVLILCAVLWFFSLLASFYPAKKAANLIPAEGIRYE